MDHDDAVAEPDWVAAGLLDPAAPGAGERAALLDYYADLGITPADVIDGASRCSVEGVAVDRLLQMPRTHTLAELAAARGVDIALARRAVLAAGFAVPPDDVPAFGAGDLAVLGLVESAGPMFGDDAALGFLRVVGSSLARIAEAADAMFQAKVERPLRAGGATSVDVARSATDATHLLLGMPDLLGPLLTRHMVAAIDRSRAARGDDPGGTGRPRLAVGFADLVGFTVLASTISGDDLTAAVDRFERTAGDLASAAKVRVVKSIGDAVMVVGADPVAVIGVLDAICRWVHDDEVLTEVRAAVAWGELLSLDGDYYGPVVNLAARAVKEAQPGEVVVTAEVAATASAAGRVFRSLGDRQLRGIDHPTALAALDSVGRQPERLA